MKFLLDANFLLIPFQFKVDIFTELTKFGKPELYTLSGVIEELEQISKKKGKSAKYAKLALQFIKDRNIRILDSKGNVDIELLRYAKQGFIVCTLDKKLASELKKEKLQVVRLRQRKYLELL